MSAVRRAAAAADVRQRGAGGGPSSRQRLPQLTVLIRPARRAPRTPFAVLLVVVAGIGLVGLLLINTRLQQGAVEISRVDRDNQILRERVQALTQTVAAAAAPGRLATRAQELGMVPNPRPAFLRISDGTVLGDPKAAEAPPPPPAPAPPTPAAQPGAAAAQPVPAPGPSPAQDQEPGPATDAAPPAGEAPQ